MGGGVSRMAKQELVATIRDRYQESSKNEKGRILDEFIAVTGHHLFRCPAKGCRLKEEGSKGWRHCDTELWEDPMDNLRVVGVVARQSREWVRHYAKRQSVERLFSSTKHSRLLDTHRFLGARKVQVHVALSLVAYQATVLARVKGGDFKNMRTMRVAAR